MNNMSFEEFKREVVERILEYLPDSFKGADVSLNVVTKANDVRLTGLTILRSGCNMAPTIYLEKFFEMYEGGDNIGVILRRIADVRVANDASDIVSVSEILDFEFLNPQEPCALTKGKILKQFCPNPSNVHLLIGMGNDKAVTVTTIY